MIVPLQDDNTINWIFKSTTCQKTFEKSMKFETFESCTGIGAECTYIRDHKCIETTEEHMTIHCGIYDFTQKNSMLQLAIKL